MIKVFDDMEIRVAINYGTKEEPVWTEASVLTGVFTSDRVRLLNTEGARFNAPAIAKQAIMQNLVNQGKVAPGNGYERKDLTKIKTDTVFLSSSDWHKENKTPNKKDYPLDYARYAVRLWTNLLGYKREIGDHTCYINYSEGQLSLSLENLTKLLLKAKEEQND